MLLPEAPNQRRASKSGTNTDIMAFSMTRVSQGKRITDRRSCLSCSSCCEAMRLRCSPLIALPSQSAAASSLQMSLFAGKSMKDINGMVVCPGGEEGRYGFTACSSSSMLATYQRLIRCKLVGSAGCGLGRPELHHSIFLDYFDHCLIAERPFESISTSRVIRPHSAPMPPCNTTGSYC